MDDRFAAAYTINKQLVIIDIMLGHYIKVERVRTTTTSKTVGAKGAGGGVTAPLFLLNLS